MKGLPYKVFVPISNYDTSQYLPIDKWCKEHIGNLREDWDASYADDNPYNVNLIYYFKQERDAVLFGLRWG